MYLLVPEVQNLSTTIIVLIVAYGIANIVIVYCRVLGSKAMKNCYKGKPFPAQAALLPSGNLVDKQTKERYYQFLSEHIPNFQIYDTDTEMKDSASTAVTWLIAQTRDSKKFPLIAEENIHFGFSYNLLGLKPYGIIVSTVGAIFNIILFISHYKNILTLTPKPLIAGFVINILFLLLWLCVITKHLVISCGRKYARALLSACDSPDLNQLKSKQVF